MRSVYLHEEQHEGDSRFSTTSSTDQEINELRNAINEKIKAEGATQKEVARSLGVSQPWVSNFLRGDYTSIKEPTLDKIRQYATLLPRTAQKRRTSALLGELLFETNKAEDEDELLFGRDGFVQTSTYESLFHRETRIFVGRKGSGKTALRKSFLQERTHSPVIADQLCLTGFDPRQFFCHTSTMLSELRMSPQVLMRNLWRYTICLRLMQQVRDNARVRILAKAHGRECSLSQIINYLEVAGFDTSKTQAPTIAACAEIQISHIHSFLQNNLQSDATELYPTDFTYQSAEDALGEILSLTNGAVVLVDDLDCWLEESNYDLMIPFLQGLISATEDLMDRHMPPNSIWIKLFIPEDLFRNMSFRHMDKLANKYETVRWTFDSLKELLARRIAIGLTGKFNFGGEEAVNHWLGRVFQNWPRGEHSMVRDYWNVLRDPLAYILLHTHYRPRDVVFFMNTIIQAAVNRRPNASHVRPEDIIEGVHAASKNQANRILQEYGQRMPYIYDVIQAFSRKRSSIEYKELERILKERMAELNIKESHSLRQTISDLYEVGFIGKFVNPRELFPQLGQVVAQEGRDYALFSYASPTTEFTDDDLVLIHPVFWRNLELPRPRELVRGVIQPRLLE